MLNLVKNACEAASHAGNSRPEIVLTTSFQHGMRLSVPGSSERLDVPLQVVVRDNGPGIPDADKPHVFDRFYRAVHTRSMPGSGLGLAIVSQCAEDNDGETYVRDNPGGGAVVGIRFR